MPGVNNGDQASSRQPSEDPSSTGVSDVSPTPQVPSLSIATRHIEKKVHKSWLKYWSSITPVICGGLGPLVTLLALSGCADKWRTKTVDGIAVEERDPKWAMVTTAVAIVLGFIANIFLLMRMMGRGNPKHMQYWSIFLWTMECNYSLICVADYSRDQLYDHRTIRTDHWQ